MGKQQRNIIFIVIGVLICLWIFWLIGQSAPYTWSENYYMDNKGPYGTFVVKELLDDYFPEEEMVIMEDSLGPLLEYDGDAPANYIFIGASRFIDSADLESLITFVDEGNNAFIISRSIADDMADYFYYYDCSDLEWVGYDFLVDTVVEMRLDHLTLGDNTEGQFEFQDRNGSEEYSWQYIDSNYICDAYDGFVQLGTINGIYPNFVRVAMGDGYFYLHTNPMAFTNLEMLEEDRLPYVSGVFSHMEKGPIFWDEYAKLTSYRPSTNSKRNFSGKSPFQYILSQPPLAWAWYLLIILTAFYFFFRTKRRQRIIPILERNENTSLEFLQTIGHLYILQNDHKKIALHKARLFFSHIRAHYGLQTNDLDEGFVKALSAKSEVEASKIDAILLLHKNINTSSIVSENTLKSFHDKIEDFYKNSK